MSNPITVRIEVDTTEAEAALERLNEAKFGATGWGAWTVLARVKEILGIAGEATPQAVGNAVKKLVSDLEAEKHQGDTLRHQLRAVRDLHERAVKERDEARTAAEMLERTADAYFNENRRIGARLKEREQLSHEQLDKMGAPRVTGLGTPMQVAGRLYTLRAQLGKMMDAVNIPRGILSTKNPERRFTLFARFSRTCEALAEYRRLFEDVKRTSWPDEAVKKIQDENAALREENTRLRDQRGVLQIDLDEMAKQVDCLKTQRDALVRLVDMQAPLNAATAEDLRTVTAERDQLQQDLHEALRLRDQALNIRNRSFEYIDAQRAAEREECAKLLEGYADDVNKFLARQILKWAAKAIRNRVRYVIGFDLGTTEDTSTAVLAQRLPDGTLQVLETFTSRFPAQRARDWLEARQKEGKLPEGRAELRRDAEVTCGQ